MVCTVKKLAGLAGVSVRTLHYYDEIGLLQPQSRSRNGYRQYGEDDAVKLQQIMFFRELGFGLEEIKHIMSRPDFDLLEALEAHRTLLKKRAERLDTLLKTVTRTIEKMKGERQMGIKDYYDGFSDEQIEKYRREVRERWGEKTLIDSEERVMKMGKERFAQLQAEGGEIFQTIADNISKGPRSPVVQAEVAKWRVWLENFSHYTDDAALGLGRAYSQDKSFAAFFKKFGENTPEFLTKAIEYYFSHKE